MAIDTPNLRRPGSFTAPRATPEWYLKFLSAETDATAAAMGFFQQGRLELEDFIRNGDLTKSDVRFYRDLLDETNRIATNLNTQSANWVSSVVPEAYTAGRRLTSSVVIPQKALQALANDPLRLLTQTSDMMRLRVRQAVAQGILQGLSGQELRNRIVSTGLTNIPRWPSIEYRAGVIARTETMKAFNQGNLDGLVDNGAKFIRWIASPDEATCPICLPRDGQVFRLGFPGVDDDTEIYPNAPMLEHAPPAHPRCRCTIRAEYRDEKGQVIRDGSGPPPIEVEPKLSQGDMGANSQPVMPPAVGDLRAAFKTLDTAAIPTTNAGMQSLTSFWRNAHFDDEALRLISSDLNFERYSNLVTYRYGISLAGDPKLLRAAFFEKQKLALLSALERFERAGLPWRDESSLLTIRIVEGDLGPHPLVKGGRVPAHYRSQFSDVQVGSNYMVKFLNSTYSEHPGFSALEVLFTHEIAHALDWRMHVGPGNPARRAWEEIAEAAKYAADAKRITKELAMYRKNLRESKATLERWSVVDVNDLTPGAQRIIDTHRELVKRYEEGIEKLLDMRKTVKARAGSIELGPTDYGRNNSFEDFAESVAIFLTRPGALKASSPQRFKYLVNLFGKDPTQ